MMRKVLLAAITITVSAYDPAWGQDSAVIEACSLEVQQELGLSDSELTQIPAGAPFTRNGRPYFFGEGENLSTACVRALAFEQSLALEKSRADTAVARSEELSAEFAEYKRLQDEKLGSWPHKLRHFTATFFVLMVMYYFFRGLFRKRSRKKKGGGTFFDP